MYTKHVSSSFHPSAASQDHHSAEGEEVKAPILSRVNEPNSLVEGLLLVTLYGNALHLLLPVLFLSNT